MHYKKYHFVCCWILLMLSCSLIMQYIHISSCPCLCTCTSYSCSCHVIISVCFMFAFIIHLFYQFLCVQWSEKSSHKKKLIINLFTSIGNGNINTNFNYDFFFLLQNLELRLGCQKDFSDQLVLFCNSSILLYQFSSLVLFISTLCIVSSSSLYHQNPNPSFGLNKWPDQPSMI